jgi:hypothetical protein
VGSNKSKQKYKRDEVLFVIPHQQKRIRAGHFVFARFWSIP